MMSQGGTLSEVQLPVRWVVLFTGSKPTEDYQPSSSVSEPSSLVREVTDLCVAFHPFDIRLFPQDGEAILFWRARATQDWVVTRVTVAPNPQGLRTALEYTSIVFTDDEFTKIGHNPFRARDLRLHEKVRQQYLNEIHEPVDVDLTGVTAVMTEPMTNGVAAPASSGPTLSADKLASPENFQALKAYCFKAEEEGIIPKTFASWWSATGDVPSDTFAIVLRAAPPKPLSLREAISEVQRLNAATKESWPSVGTGDTVVADLSLGIITKADMMVASLNSLAARSNVDSVVEFQAGMAEAASYAEQIARDIELFRIRYQANTDAGENARLTALANRYKDLGRELGKVPHPNPFAGNTVAGKPQAKQTGSRNGASGSTTINGTRPTPTKKEERRPSGGMNPAAIGTAVVVIGGIAAGAYFLKGGNNPGKTPPSTKPSATASAPASGGTKPASASPEDQAKALLAKNQDTVTESAKKAAAADARQAALESGNVSDSRIERITLNAVKNAYKETMSASDYTKVQDKVPGVWTFDKLKDLAPEVVLTVQGEAKAAAIAAKAEKDQKALQDKLKKAQSTPAPAPTPRHSNNDRGNDRGGGDERPTTKKHDRGEDKPKPKPRESAKPKGSEGSAAGTGL